MDKQYPTMASFEEIVHNAPIEALHNFWAIKSEEIDQNIQSYDEQIIITRGNPARMGLRFADAPVLASVINFKDLFELTLLFW